MATRLEEMQAALGQARRAITILEDAAHVLARVDEAEREMAGLQLRIKTLGAEVTALEQRRDVEAQALREGQAKVEQQHDLARKQAQNDVSLLMRQVADAEKRLETTRATIDQETRAHQAELTKLAELRADLEQEILVGKAAHQSQLAQQRSEAQRQLAHLEALRQQAEADLAEAQAKLKDFHAGLAALTPGAVHE